MHDWGNILPAVIIPFLETHTKENTFHSYYLTLNYAGGEQIRVVVLTDVEDITWAMNNCFTNEFAFFIDDTLGFLSGYFHFFIPDGGFYIPRRKKKRDTGKKVKR